MGDSEDRKPAAAKQGAKVVELAAKKGKTSKNGQPKPNLSDVPGKEDKPKQADVLIQLAQSRTKLFRTEDDAKYSTFADIEHGNGRAKRRETHAIEGPKFKSWLRGLFYESQKTAVGTEALNAAVGTLVAMARSPKSPLREVSVRCAQHNGELYIDLGDPSWCAYRVTESGWERVNQPPVRFRRGDGMRPLPHPEQGGGLDLLRAFINVKDEDSFYLLCGWLVAALRADGPYPVLVINGDQGSAKSTLTKILRSLVDPSRAPLRTLPKSDRDLYITANNSWTLVFDNCSSLQPWLSDDLCRLSTGGGFATRQLFSDADEVIFSSMRPIILNGITEFVSRGDLADRALLIQLEPIGKESRRTERDIFAQFESVRPKILGALLDAMVTGLGAVDSVKLESLPRMAEFAVWAEACSPDFAPNEGDFLRAYESNQSRAVESVIEADPVAEALRNFAYGLDEDWEGTTTALLKQLEELVGERVRSQKNFPKSHQALTARIARVGTPLRQIGIHIERQRRGNKERRLTVHKAERPADEAPA